MHVYKFLDERGGIPTREKTCLLGGDLSQARAVDQMSGEARAARPRIDEVDPVPGRSQVSYKRLPGWALRWEGSLLNMTEE